MSEEQPLDETPKVDFNLKGRLIMTIGENLHEATALFSYDPRKSFIKLKAIRILITHRLEKGETTSLKEQESILDRALKIPYTLEKMRVSYGGHLDDNPEAQQLARNLIALKKKANLESYFEELMDCLNKYGFLLGEKINEETEGFH